MFTAPIDPHHPLLSTLNLTLQSNLYITPHPPVHSTHRPSLSTPPLTLHSSPACQSPVLWFASHLFHTSVYSIMANLKAGSHQKMRINVKFSKQDPELQNMQHRFKN